MKRKKEWMMEGWRNGKNGGGRGGRTEKRGKRMGEKGMGLETIHEQKPISKVEVCSLIITSEPIHDDGNTPSLIAPISFLYHY